VPYLGFSILSENKGFIPGIVLAQGTRDGDGRGDSSGNRERHPSVSIDRKSWGIS
jgi:hypothetical protein